MITLKNVSKWYGHFQVLTDCSTEVKKGEVVVVCGPSGSGKSTLIKTVNGTEPIQQGQIIVDGTTVNDKRPISPNCARGSGWYSSISSCSRTYRLLITSPGAG